MKSEGSNVMLPILLTGLRKWNDDGPWKDGALGMVYSLNKKDIRAIRGLIGRGAAAP